MRRTIVDVGTFLANAADAVNIASGEAEVSGIPLSTQTRSGYIPGNKNQWPREKLQENNEMEWEKRPMLGAKRIYLQYEADVLMSTRARK